MDVVVDLPNVELHKSSLCDTLGNAKLHEDQIFVESVQALVDPIDDKIDYSCKNELSPPSASTCNLNKVPMPSNESNQTLVDPCTKQESEGSKFTCGIEHSLSRYNISFKDGLITPNEPSGDNDIESIAFLEGYILYTNPLWSDNIPPKDENLLLKEESILKGKECIVILENPRANVSLTPWGNVSEYASFFDTLILKLHESQLVDAKLFIFLKGRMCVCLNALPSIVHAFTLDSFLYYLFAYDNVHASLGITLLGGIAFEPSRIPRRSLPLMKALKWNFQIKKLCPTNLVDKIYHESILMEEKN
ncbi:hypothetical protein FXO38_27771 [Capsicum annuum]|nr:hypothetical protein FXO38_27771 [Capsicum annuum]